MSLLRNANINYDHGWFFITFQVAHNKSALGAIIGQACALNALGEMVEATWRSQPEHTPELTIDAFVVMPNHFHAICRVGAVSHPHDKCVGAVSHTYDKCVGAVSHTYDKCAGAVSPTYDKCVGAVSHTYDKCADAVAHPKDAIIVASAHCGGGGLLSQIIGRFKSYTTHLYHKMKTAGECVDIGPQLWMESYYDNLITSEAELEAVRRYIAENPSRWNRDRFGAVTTFGVGNAELLSCRLVAFVASETPKGASFAQPKQWNSGRIVSLTIEGETLPVISTFTSPEERTILARCLRHQRAFIWVCPGGIPEPLPLDVAKACAEGRAFVCSPVISKTGVNKQRAIWCNQYVLEHAEAIWVGTIRPGGSLETLLKTLKTNALGK